MSLHTFDASSPPGRNPSTSSRNHHNHLTSPSQNAHKTYTLTACRRCRTRKCKCDAGLPRCSHCQRADEVCEYWDQSKGKFVKRAFIVYLQDEVTRLENELAQHDIHETSDADPELLVREPAVVNFRETMERKFLGPSSGTSMIRLVMHLAKQVVDAGSIRDIISDDRARRLEERVTREETKPTSLINTEEYPLVSSYAAKEMPLRGLAILLLDLYNLKVQSLYPVFHEPTLLSYFDDVYRGSQDPFRLFVVRMVIAIGLQRLHDKYAGTADSYYLGALTVFKEVVRPMTLETLQCFILIGQYSLLTPTRTAVFYVIGLAVRLAQTLGISDERTLQVSTTGMGRASDFEIDMKRRTYWAIVSMEFALAHSLGRPSMLATKAEHIDVKFFADVADEYITHEGIRPGTRSVRKWIAQQFYRMRLLQLEIRRTLYLSKRKSPETDDDPWFEQMHLKLRQWRDANPPDVEESGVDREWFETRYNAMIVFLCRPSPQVPHRSAQSAWYCYEASEYNIHMQRSQVQSRSVELTWVFTQQIFMAVNAILWSLSYAEVRKVRSKDRVRAHLDTALEAMRLASSRWPGVASAAEMYETLIDACLKIYDRYDDGSDVPIHPSPPVSSDPSTSLGGESPRSQYDILSSNGDVASHTGAQASSRSRASSSPSGANHRQSLSPRLRQEQYGQHLSPDPGPWHDPFQDPNGLYPHQPPGDIFSLNMNANGGHHPPPRSSYNPPLDPSQYYAMPSTFAEMQDWQFHATAMPTANTEELTRHASFYDTTARPNPGTLLTAPESLFDFERGAVWSGLSNSAEALSPAQHRQLMHSLESNDMHDIEAMIQRGNDFFRGNG